MQKFYPIGAFVQIISEKQPEGFTIRVASVIAFFVIGYQRDTINLSWHIVPILILYPIWGTIQQFLVIGLVAGNLQDLKRNRLNEFVIITSTAILFGLVHRVRWSVSRKGASKGF